MTVLSIAGQISIVLGALILVSAGLGVIRFPDVYTRASAVSTAAGFGIVFVIGGALLVAPSVPDILKVALIIPVQLLTSAVASTFIARSAYITGIPVALQKYNELEEGRTPD